MIFGLVWFIFRGRRQIKTLSYCIVEMVAAMKRFYTEENLRSSVYPNLFAAEDKHYTERGFMKLVKGRY